MPSTPPILHQTTLPEIPTITQVFLRSFTLDPVSHAVFPRGPVTTKWFDEALSSEHGDATSRFVHLTTPVQNEQSNGETETVIAFAKWVAPDDEKTMSEMSKRDDEEEELPEWPRDERSDHDLARRFFGGLARKRRVIMSGRAREREDGGQGKCGYWYLEMLGTIPDYQGKGAGSILVRWGLDQADAEGRESYLESSPGAVNLYKRLGFEVVDEAVVTLQDGSTYSNYCMVRKPQPKS